MTLFVVINFLVVAALLLGARLSLNAQSRYEGSFYFNVCAIGLGVWCAAVGAVYVVVTLYRFCEAVIRIILS